MKKSFLFSLAALALVACAKDAAVKVSDSNGIKFNTVVDYPTRGTAVETSTLNEFKAYGYYGTSDNVFEGKNVSNTTGSWVIEGAPYNWPGKNTEVTFYAYAPKDLNGVSISNAEQKLENFTPEIKAEDQKDPIFTKAKGSEATTGQTGVTLTFKHILAQTEIKAQIKAESGYTIKVLSAKIERAHKTATFTLPGDLNSLSETAWVVSPGNDKNGRFVAIKPKAEAIDLDGTSKSCQMGRGNFFTLPGAPEVWNGNADGDNNGLWLGLAVIIKDKHNKQVYPVLRTTSNPNDGLYGYVAFPMTLPMGKKFIPGKKYTYNIILGGNTLGQVPPTTDGFEDPSNPQNPDIDKTPNRGDDGDKYKPGEPIKSAEIVFGTVTVDPYTEEEVITIGA